MRSYLAKRIYPNCSTFVKIITRLLGGKIKYSERQKSLGIKRVFGVLQFYFTIIHGHVQYWDEKHTCKYYKILHNNM
jgi:hypothetical protein